MSPLTLIWVAALALAGLAIGWMSVLIVLRLFRQRADARRAVDRGAVMRAFMDVLKGAGDPAVSLAPYAHRARLMAEAILELHALVRGADQVRILDLLRRIGTVGVLIDRLDHGSRTGRLLSLEALSALGGDEAQSAMRRAVRAKEPIVRLAALKGLVDSGAPPSVGAMLDHVHSGDIAPSGVFSELLLAVVAHDPDRAIQSLSRTDLTPLVRILLLDAVGRAGAYQAVPALVEAARDPEPEIRIAAIRGLGRLKHPAGGKALAAALADESWIVRAAAAEGIGAVGLVRLAPALAVLMNDGEWWVRFRAGAALRRLGAPGVQALSALAEGGGATARDAAAMALAERV